MLYANPIYFLVLVFVVLILTACIFMVGYQ